MIRQTKPAVRILVAVATAALFGLVPLDAQALPGGKIPPHTGGPQQRFSPHGAASHGRHAPRAPRSAPAGHHAARARLAPPR
jgi:hypothetical protein